MDTVIGRIGGKVLLTFTVSFCNFLFARLLDNKSALEVVKHLYAIKNAFFEAGFDFFEIFPVILTDNAGEFARVDDIEMDVRGELKLFFCEPNRSDQKARIEKNHTLIRDILPKGSSFDDLTREDINRICSHISYQQRKETLFEWEIGLWALRLHLWERNPCFAGNFQNWPWRCPSIS